ncbi:MAG: dTDP-4-amino-4,6-dideoxygalactose transaminase [Magnetococcales bacterium]|nr:dTDP-4-amino-4,6-dideoxygalactose transaminase [Magnetococcales bacterium]
MVSKIPFNKPAFFGKEFQYVQQALDAGHLSSSGRFTRACTNLLEQLTGAPRVLLTTSCTHALEMAAILLNIVPGDEVIVPSYTFPTTASAFALRGGKVVFADIRPDTLNLDERHLEKLITPKTRAIVPVHYAGVGCEMDAITAIATTHSLAVVEDNAQGLFGQYRGQQLGRFGVLSAVSFHETKNISCGEGGCLLINDPGLIERAEILLEKGTNRRAFFRGEVDKYTWVDLGSSYGPSDLMAAILLAQLEERQAILARRRSRWRRYADALRSWGENNGVTLPYLPAHCDPSYHLFYLVLPSPELRDAMLRHLGENGVGAVFHYVPLHLSQVGRAMGGRDGQCPVSEAVYNRLLRLPLYNTLDEADQERVIDLVMRFPFA